MRCWNSSEISQTAAVSRAGVFAALLLLCGTLAVEPAFGQEASRPVQPDKPAVLPPPVSDTPGLPAVPPAWEPSLEWSPYKPGLLVESDCFVNADIAVVFPHLSSLLTAPVQLGENGPTRLVVLRNTGLNTTVSPLIQLGGFRFGPGYGELAISYRLLTTDGNDYSLGAGDTSAFHARSRLNFQTFSFDYLRNDCPISDVLLLSWDIGARLQVVFFDTQVQATGSYQQARNNFFGAGPHAGLGLMQMLPNGFGVYGRFDAALIAGYNTAQNFVLTTNDPASGGLSGTAHQEQTELGPSFALQAGLAWTPHWLLTSRLRTGYQFEQWYNLGRVGAARGDLNAHGLFLSLEVGF
jgi:hypothetical protein